MTRSSLCMSHDGGRGRDHRVKARIFPDRIVVDCIAPQAGPPWLGQARRSAAFGKWALATMGPKSLLQANITIDHRSQITVGQIWSKIGVLGGAVNPPPGVPPPVALRNQNRLPA